MSWTPCPEAETQEHPKDIVETVVIPRTHDVGNFEVRRALPTRQRRMVGPFIFWDQMGPGEFLTGEGADVKAHPHIGLSTLTYLFDGAMTHRDSLGVVQDITPGAVNLMTAGNGIAHSERTTPEMRRHPHKLYGIQSWLALPETHEESAPAFAHTAAVDIPVVRNHGVEARVIAGSLFGAASPVVFPHDVIYADIKLQAGAKMPVPAGAEERALYPLNGRLQVGDTVYDPMQLLVLKPGVPVTIRAETDTHVMLLGGAVMDGPRYIWWNFVSSDKDRIEDAKRGWKSGDFPQVPAEEIIPLPEI